MADTISMGGAFEAVDRPAGRALGRAATLYAIALLSGAAVMAYEILASRVIAPYFGSSVYTWGNLIGVVLMALATGYIAGGWLADRFMSGVLPGLFLIASGGLVAATPFLAAPVSAWALSLGMPMEQAALAACLALFFPASALMGTTSPFALKLLARSMRSIGSASGTLYGVSTIGSLMGTFLTTLYLVNVPWLGSRRCLLLAAAVLVLAGAGTEPGRWRRS
jgi:hypothetical protein